MNIGLGNKIIPFKGREVNVARPVKVYRNLHAKTAEHKYSVSQDGLVVGHTNQLMLENCRFHVSDSGRTKVRRTGCKIVHAFIIGRVSMRGERGMGRLPAHISYNPYEDYHFMCKNLLPAPIALRGADVIVLQDSGVSGAYLWTA